MDTTPLVQLEGQGGVEAWGSVEGSIVKVAPTLMASQKGSFDGAGLVRQLREEGALAVQLAPRVVPDTVRAKAKPEVVRAISPEEALSAWLGAQPALNEGMREDAMALGTELLAMVRKDS